MHLYFDSRRLQTPQSFAIAGTLVSPSSKSEQDMLYLVSMLVVHRIALQGFDSEEQKVDKCSLDLQ